MPTFSCVQKPEYTCCLCHKEFDDYGWNPRPLVMEEGARACNECFKLVEAYRNYIEDKVKDIETNRKELDKALEYYELLPMEKKLELAVASISQKDNKGQ